MMYFSPAAAVWKGADPSLWGLIVTPQGGVKRWPTKYRWIADNGCFTQAFDEGKWLHWLHRQRARRKQCVMVTLPDVVGDAYATLDRFAHYYPIIRSRRWPIGLVAQDGLESLPWPADYDALFIGGSTTWKLSDAADWCIKRAQEAGKWVHVGRCNGGKRIKHFKLNGVNSVDGTSICYNPKQEFRRINNALAYQPLFLLD